MNYFTLIWEEILMKKSFFVVLFFFVTSGIALSPKATSLTYAVANPEEVLLGDINSDSSIDSIDLACMKKYLVGKIPGLPGEEKGLIAADIDKSGKVDSIDIAHLKNYLIGKGTIPPTPVEDEIVVFENEYLKSIVLKELAKNSNDLIYKSELDKIEALFLYEPIDLSEIIFFDNLKILYISFSDTSDISPLAKFTNLTHLQLNSANITDISLLKDFYPINLFRFGRK